jgi:RNA polymerase sigma factor (TIGR02999 family)
MGRRRWSAAKVRQIQAEVNQLFSTWSESRKQSIPELFELIYKELRQIAQSYMRRERPNHTLQTTALVNEAYLRMFQGQPFRWENRKHVFCLMAQTMRRVLVDHARSHYAHKRGGERQRLSLDQALLISEENSPELFALDEALERLAKLHARQGHVVELRFFGGLTVEETAAVLGVSPETVKLDWRFAMAWLQRELGHAT